MLLSHSSALVKEILWVRINYTTIKYSTPDRHIVITNIQIYKTYSKLISADIQVLNAMR